MNEMLKIMNTNYEILQVLSIIPSNKTELAGLLWFMPYTYITYSAKLDKYCIGACVYFEKQLRERNTGNLTFASTSMFRLRSGNCL